MQIKSFFNYAGNIYKNKNVVHYQVRSINELTKIIIPHFEKYPLLTQKQNDFASVNIVRSWDLAFFICTRENTIRGFY